MMRNRLMAPEINPPAPNPDAQVDARNAAPEPALPQAFTPPPLVPQQVQPPLAHIQVMATLRHLDEWQTRLKPILRNPDLGRANMKSSITDAVIELVAERMVTAGQAAMQLATVPDDPLLQRKWAMAELANVMKSKFKVIHEYRMTTPGTLDAPTDLANSQYTHNPDRHQEIMSGVHAHMKHRERPYHQHHNGKRK